MTELLAKVGYARPFALRHLVQTARCLFLPRTTLLPQSDEIRGKILTLLFAELRRTLFEVKKRGCSHSLNRSPKQPSVKGAFPCRTSTMSYARSWARRMQDNDSQFVVSLRRSFSHTRRESFRHWLASCQPSWGVSNGAPVQCERKSGQQALLGNVPMRHESPIDDTLPANRRITLRDLLTFRSG